MKKRHERSWEEEWVRVLLRPTLLERPQPTLLQPFLMSGRGDELLTQLVDEG